MLRSDCLLSRLHFSASFFLCLADIAPECSQILPINIKQIRCSLFFGLKKTPNSKAWQPYLPVTILEPLANMLGLLSVVSRYFFCKNNL